MERQKKSEFSDGLMRHLFHVHTCYTDGKLSASDWFEIASKVGVRRITFLEHTRRAPSYDINDLKNEVCILSKRFGIEGTVGVEARILPDGVLDISEETLMTIDVLGIAEHSFPFNNELYYEAWTAVLKNYRTVFSRVQTVWVHPGLYWKKHDLLDTEKHRYELQIHEAIEAGLLIEKNIRYDLLPDNLIHLVPKAKLIVGLDGHRREDIVLWLSHARMQY